MEIIREIFTELLPGLIFWALMWHTIKTTDQKELDDIK